MKYLILTLLSLFTFAEVPGLKAGDAVPSITLKSISGKTYQLDKLDKKTAIIFYRGSWCPYCMKQLQSVQEDVMNKIGSDSQIIAVSVDRAMVAKKMKAKNKFSFAVISDPKAKSLAAFKIINKVDDKLVNF